MGGRFEVKTKGEIMTIEEKALAACIEYVAAGAEIKRLGAAIGDALCRCHETFASQQGTQWMAYKSHLEAAYASEENEETQYSEGRKIYLGPADQMEILGACPHCLAAHNAIQDRKKARQRLGNAKRNITRIGKR